MSGGFFDYKQYVINGLIDGIERVIARNSEEEYYRFSGEVLEKFWEGIRVLRMGEIYAQRIDWLVSGDDSERGFMERLGEELDGVDREILMMRERIETGSEE